MKKLITNNWKKILVFIGSIFIIINIFTKLTINKTLLDDYIKYGKDIEKIDIISGDVSGIIDVPEAPLGPDLLNVIIMVVAAILLIVFLTSLGDKAAANAKKK